MGDSNLAFEEPTRAIHWGRIITVFFSQWAAQISHPSESLLDLGAVCNTLLWQSEGMLERLGGHFNQHDWQQALFEQAVTARHAFPFDPDLEERTVAPNLRVAERQLVVDNGTLAPDFLAYAAMDTLEHLVGSLAMSLALQNGTRAVQRVTSWARGSQKHAAIWTYLAAQPKTQQPSQLWRDAAETFHDLTYLPGYEGLHAMGHGFFHRAAQALSSRTPKASWHAGGAACSPPRLLHATLPMSRTEAAEALRACDAGSDPRYRRWCAGGFYHSWWRQSQDLGEAVARRVSAAGGDRGQARFRDECVGLPFEDVCLAHADNLANQGLSNRPARYQIPSFPFLAPNSLGSSRAWGFEGDDWV